MIYEHPSVGIHHPREGYCQKNINLESFNSKQVLEGFTFLTRFQPSCFNCRRISSLVLYRYVPFVAKRVIGELRIVRYALVDFEPLLVHCYRTPLVIPFYSNQRVAHLFSPARHELGNIQRFVIPISSC